MPHIAEHPARFAPVHNELAAVSAVLIAFVASIIIVVVGAPASDGNAQTDPEIRETAWLGHPLPGIDAQPRVRAEASVAAETEALAPSVYEAEMFSLVNRDRLRNGLPAVEFDVVLVALARERAQAQRARHELAHRDASGTLDFAAGLAAMGVSFQVAAENLARVPMSGIRAPEAAEAALMNSDSHRAIILHSAFDRLAVGSTVDASGQTVFAQIFRAAGLASD